MKKKYRRLLDLSTGERQSVFLFGSRGTGKTSWIESQFPQALIIDLLKTSTFRSLVTDPSQLERLIPPDHQDWVVIDEIQKVPELLNEVHRLIETKNIQFLLTGSSARSLRRKGVNLLAGRALDYRMHPLTCTEIGKEFSLEKALQGGLLPSAYCLKDPAHYLESYVGAYLKEEVLQEGLTRNVGEFARFLEIASFSQGEQLNISEIAREVGIKRPVVMAYFDILEDLLLGVRLPVFSKRAKRKLVTHDKFYYFDAGVYRALRPKGPLDSPEEADGPLLETLFFQHLRAFNDYYRLNHQLFFWRSVGKEEVDFIAYGEKGLYAFEIKRTKKLSSADLQGLRAFGEDYPEAKLMLLYGGEERQYEGNIQIIPFTEALFQLKELLVSQRKI